MNDDVFNDLGLPPLAEMDEEHEAWKEICQRLRSVNRVWASWPGSGSAPDWDIGPVLNQIKYWGETLHKLRLANPQYDDKAYAEPKEVAAS